MEQRDTTNRVQTAAVLGATGLAATLWVTRLLVWTPLFQFLWWNLLLAWIPWLLSRALCASPRSRVTFGFGFGVWLLFFPNAPYLITDLVHLRYRAPVPIWFDLFLIAAFAVAGLLLGLSSLGDMHHELIRRFGAKRAFFSIVLIILMTGYGVFLGRIEQLNSWDLVTKPLVVLTAPLRHLGEPEAAGFTLAFAAFVGVTYAFFAPHRRTSNL